MASTSLQVIHNQLLSNVHLNLLRALTAAGLMLDWRVGGQGFDSQGLKMTEKWRYCFCPANGWTFARLAWPHKMAVTSPSRRCKNSVPNKYYYCCAKYSDIQNKVHLKKTLRLTKLWHFQQCKRPFVFTSQGVGEGVWKGYNFLRGLILGVNFENAQNVRGVKILRHRAGLLCKSCQTILWYIEANPHFLQKKEKKFAWVVLCQQQNVTRIKLGPETYQQFLVREM